MSRAVVGHSGIIDQQIESAPLGIHFIGQGVDFIPLCQVDDADPHFAGDRSQLGSQCLQCICIHIDQPQQCPGLCKLSRDGPANSASRSSDQCLFASKIPHRNLLVPLTQTVPAPSWDGTKNNTPPLLPGRGVTLQGPLESNHHEVSNTPDWL